MSSNDKKANLIYVFRCNDSALYAFTGDPSGQILPSHIYPRVSWRLERCVTLHRYQKQVNKKVITATLKAIRKHGFYLTHAGDELVRLAD